MKACAARLRLAPARAIDGRRGAPMAAEGLGG
jgi:hypothetical protein